MPNRMPQPDDPLVRETLVAIDAAFGPGVVFQPIEPGGDVTLESVMEEQSSTCVAPVTHKRRLFGVLRITPGSAADQYQADKQAHGDIASKAEALQMFARLLGTLLATSRSLTHRVAELNAVYRVSSAMTESTTIDDLLHTALRVVTEVVDVTAGSIRLLRSEIDLDQGDSSISMSARSGNPENELIVRAAINLSQEYIDCGPFVVTDSELDVRSMAGEMVYVEDLRNDTHVRFPELVEREHLLSLLSTGLVFDGTPIGILRLYTKRASRRFSEYEQGLVRVAAQQIASAIVNRKLILEQRQARQVKRQLDLASSVQQRMLPQEAPRYDGVDLAARCLPSLELGGDFFDFLTLNDNNLGLAIGDVVGKGVPAALMAASVKAELRAHARYLYDLVEILKRTNRDLVHDTRPNEFATLWYGVLDVPKLRLTFCNAGHEPPLVCRQNPAAADGYEFVKLFTGGMIIGYDEAFEFTQEFIDLQEGDVLIAFSDGLTDAMNFDNERYQLHRVQKALLALLDSQPDASANDILNHLLWEVRRFFGFRQQSDDITLLVARIAHDAKPTS